MWFLFVGLNWILLEASGGRHGMNSGVRQMQSPPRAPLPGAIRRVAAQGRDLWGWFSFLFAEMLQPLCSLFLVLQVVVFSSHNVSSAWEQLQGEK